MYEKLLRKQIIKNILFNIAGCFIYALGINSFAAPHNIAPGGASGVAILLNYLFHIPIGFFVFVFNIPLLALILVKNYFSKIFVGKVLISTLLLSLITDLIVARLPVYKGDALLASMFAGALMGMGLALVHLGGSNTGGISLIGIIVQKIRPEFQVGTLISGLNMAIVLASGIIYKNIETMLYAIVVVYISGFIMDRTLANAYMNNLLLIISEKTEKIKEFFLEHHSGVTILKGEGGFSHQEKNVILCVATKHNCVTLQKYIWEIDNQALPIVLDSSKVSGKGFQSVM